MADADTRDKRFSFISIAQPTMWTAPNPDGGFTTEADRAHLDFMYGGITASGPVVENNAAGVMLMWHRRRR